MSRLYPCFQCYNPLVSYSGRLSIFFGLIGVCLLLISACQGPAAATQAVVASPRPSLTSTPAPPTSSPTITSTRTPRLTPTFAPPSLLAVTVIPAPVTNIQRPEEVMVLVVVLNQHSAPFVGLSQAVMVVFYHPRLGRASLMPLPPDLMVYIPGYTMQRLQIAQPVGGMRLLDATLAYNLGVWPDYWLTLTPDGLVSLINDLGGLDLNIVRDYPNHCGGIPGGPVYMTGEQVQCFIAFRDGTDEDDRGIRQQEVFRQVLQRLADGGRLAQLAQYYQKYWVHPNSNIGLQEWTDAIPLILKLADPNRIGFFSLFDQDRILWRLPTEVDAYVLLPQPDVLAARVQAAIDYVLTPMPLSEQFLTRQAALTITPTGTPTPLGNGPQISPTSIFPTGSVAASWTPSPSISPTVGSGPTFTPTPTLAISLTPTLTPTRSATLDPYPGGTPTRTWTPNVNATPTLTVTVYP